MFCSNCGNKVEDNAVFCPQCGSRVMRNDSSVTLNSNSQKQTRSTGFINLDAKKCMYGLVISLILIVLFGGMANHALHPAKRVIANVVDKDEAIASKGDDGVYVVHQYIKAEYKHGSDILTWSGDITMDEYSSENKIKLYLLNGDLCRKDSVKSNVVGFIIFTILFLLSIGSCILFGLQYSKKRR